MVENAVKTNVDAINNHVFWMWKLFFCLCRIVPNKEIQKINNNEYVFDSSGESSNIYQNIGSIIIEPPEPNKPKSTPEKTNNIYPNNSSIAKINQ